jgi:diguanylate cyclase (GGDEF)-like protein/PAS domain S-box-containing protein
LEYPENLPVKKGRTATNGTPPETGETAAISNSRPASVPVGFLRTDQAGIIQEVSSPVPRWLGTTSSGINGQGLVLFIAPEEQEDLNLLLSVARESGQPQECRFSFCYRGGRKFSAAGYVSPTHNSHGKLTGYHWLLRKIDESNLESQHFRDPEAFEQRVIAQTRELLLANQHLTREIENRVQIENEMRRSLEELEGRAEKRAAELAIINEKLHNELTERKRAELAAARRARELSALHAATAALLTTLDLEELLGQILDAATSAIPAAEKGMLHLVARDTGQLEMRAAIGYTDNRIQKFSFPGSKGYVAKAVRLRTPLLIKNVQTDPSIRYEGQIPEVRAIQSAIVVPLILQDQVIGAVSLDASKRAVFSEDDLWLLVSFAATATAAIRNSQLHMEMQRLAITDSLTSLYNRRGLYELGRREIERARRFGRPLTAIMFDIDLFKKVNDSFGHNAGDQVLRLIADRISRNIREVDILGRYGGDEFVILLSETDMFTAVNLSERLLACISETPFIIEGGPAINLTISIGIAKASVGTQDLTSLIHSADKALYAAKLAGRNKIEFS